NNTIKISLGGETINSISEFEDPQCPCAPDDGCDTTVISSQQSYSIGNYWPNYVYGGENSLFFEFSSPATFLENVVMVGLSLIFLHYDNKYCMILKISLSEREYH